MHLRAAHLLQGDLLADDHLGQARRTDVGAGRAAHHDHEVTQPGYVRGAGRVRPEQRAHLRHPPGVLDQVGEDQAPGVSAGVAVELLVDARPGRVHEVDDGDAGGLRPGLQVDNFLERAPAPGARLDGEVIGDDRDGSPVHLPDDGDHRVAGQALLGAGQQPVLEVRHVVQQQREALAHQQPACGRLLFPTFAEPPASAVANRRASSLCTSVMPSPPR